MDTHSLCLQKVKELYLSIFFVIERSDTILIEKSHYFVAFFLEVCIYIPVACQFIKKDWQATGLLLHKPQKVHLAHFCLGVPKTLYI